MSAGASLRTRSPSCCARLTESGARRRGSSRPPRRCGSSGRADLGRAVRPAGGHRRLGRRPRRAARAARPGRRPRRRRAGDRRPAGQGRARAGRRPAHQRPAHRALPGACSPRRCTPRCGSTRPPGPTSRPCARAASSSSTRPWAGSPAPTPGRAGCPSRSRSCRSRCACWPRRAGGADLAGRRVVVSAGGTREPLDPVRFLGNRSSGRQGYALAATAAARGAEVVLVSANVALPDPAGVERRPRWGPPTSCATPCSAAAADADVVVMAAAVADFRPASVQGAKIKKDDAGGVPEPIALVRNPDVLAELVAARSGTSPVVVGFAAETGDDDRGLAGARAGQAGPQGLRPARGQPGRRGRGLRGAPTTPAVVLGGRRQRGRACRWAARRRWPTPSGTPWPPAWSAPVVRLRQHPSSCRRS